jgi:hypothetical protein
MYTKKEKEIKKMKVTLMVNWREKEILTVKELDERINARVKEIMEDEEAYEECLEDYLDCKYTNLELFNALIGNKDEIEEVINDVRAGVAEDIYDWASREVRDDYHEITIEV